MMAHETRLQEKVKRLPLFNFGTYPNANIGYWSFRYKRWTNLAITFKAGFARACTHSLMPQNMNEHHFCVARIHKHIVKKLINAAYINISACTDNISWIFKNLLLMFVRWPPCLADDTRANALAPQHSKNLPKELLPNHRSSIISIHTSSYLYNNHSINSTKSSWGCNSSGVEVSFKCP